jgi:hypothetical protein
LATRKAWPELRSVSLKRQISTPFWLRKCSSSSFLPRTPAAFQQARRKALPRTVLLGRAAIFGYEENSGLQYSGRAGCPCVKRGDGREEPKGQLHTGLQGMVIEEIRDSLEWVGGALGGYHQDGSTGFTGRGFHTRGYFPFLLTRSRLSGCCVFTLRLLMPGRLPGGGHIGIPWHLRDRLRRGFV